MRAFFPAAGLTLVLAACGGAAAPSPSAAASTAAASAPALTKPASVAAAAGASGKPAASGSAAAQAGPTFNDGTVAAVDATKLTLADGNKAFTLAASTTYVKLQKESASDVKSGQFVAITGKQQPDNTLLASFLRLQDSSGGRPANQSPMDQFANGQPVTGNLMTNAPVKSADANGMVITLAGGDVTVKYAPGIQIVHQAGGVASDVKAGVKVLVLSRGAAAINVGVYV